MTTRGCKEANIAESNKMQENVENYNRPHPEQTQYIEEEEYCIYLPSLQSGSI